jgi:exodeoxyribonuclease VII large subunit
MILALDNRLHMDKLRLRNLLDKLRAAAPRQQLRLQEQHLSELAARLRVAVERRIGESRHKLSVLAAALQTVSPLATLERGYALVTEKNTGKIIDDTAQLEIDQIIAGRLARGTFEALIKKKD